MKSEYIYPIKSFRFFTMAMLAAATLNGCGGKEGSKNGDLYAEPRVTISESILDGKQVFVRSFVGDVNNDGFEDVIAIGSRDEFLILTNNKQGMLTPFNGSGSTLKGVESLVDLNQDGNLDLVVLSGGNWSAAFGNGDGTFNDPEAYNQVLSESHTSVDFGDFDGNAILDLVAADDRGVTLFLADEEGSYNTNTMSDSPGVVHVADLNADGIDDIVMTNPYRIALHVGKGDGTFGLPQISDTGIYFKSDAEKNIFFRDLNGDRWLDIAYLLPSNLHVLLYDHENGFTGGFSLSVRNAADYNVDTFYLDSFTVADMNCDGAEDLVLAEFASGTVKVLSNNADGTFRKAVELDPNKKLRQVAAVDVNLDGIQDLFALPGGEVYTNLSCLP